MTIASPSVGVANARSQAERAYWMLADRIIRLELPPGTLLLDREIMAELGIGRTPIREAIQRLSAEGLTVHYPHRGVVVSEVTASGTRDIYEFRALIDGEAARLAAMRRTDEESQLLVRLSEELKTLSAGDDADAYVAKNREFFATLSAAARNQYIEETIMRMFNLHFRLWFFISSKSGDWKRLVEAHSEMAGEMAEAIHAGDHDNASLAVRAYISQRQKDMRSLI